MSKQGRHHYIPIFYLKQWAGEDQRICEFSKPHDRVKPRRVHPAGTGYMDGLNTVEELPRGEQQYLENEFYKEVDDTASRALRILLAPPPWHLTNDERDGWSRFIMSLMIRHPEGIRKFTKLAIELFDESVPLIDDQYARGRGPDDPETYAEYAAIHGPSPRGRTIVRIIQGMVDNAGLGRGINSMRWTVLSQHRPDFPLLTSDRPLMMTKAFGRRGGHIIMPISPSHIFLAAADEDTEREIRRLWKTRAYVRQLNERIASQSRKYVFGTDDAQLPFVSKRLGRALLADPLESLTHEFLKAAAQDKAQAAREDRANVTRP